MRAFHALFLIAGLVFAGEGPAASDGGDPFAHDLFARLATRDGNLVLSPLSIRAALAMTYGGARGDTAKEMAAVLRCDEGIHARLAALTASFERTRDEGLELSVANALWAQEGDPFLPVYLELMRKHYAAPTERLDFAQNEAAARRINGWTAERTHDRVREIVPPELLGPSTSLVLTNAIYFRGTWAQPFSDRLTRELPFALAAGGQVAVPFMRRTGTIPYAEVDGARAIELAYAGDRLGMVVVLPAPESQAVPERIVAALAPRSVEVFLPRFRFETSLRLEQTLKAMGMARAFGPGADFSGMNGATDLFISAVTHRAFVAVDESGTEAAAATAVVMKRGAPPAADVVFRADRPFLFLIRDRETGAILFLGRVSDPRG